MPQNFPEIFYLFFYSIQTIFLQPFHLSTIYPIQETKP